MLVNAKPGLNVNKDLVSFVVKVKKQNENLLINNGNRTEWSPIRSVIIRVINTHIDNSAVGGFS